MGYTMIQAKSVSYGGTRSLSTPKYIVIHYTGNDGDTAQGNGNYFANIFYGFRPSVIKSNLKLYIALIVYALFNIAIQIYMPYLILYYNVSLAMDNYVLIMAPAILLAAIFTAIYGQVYDKKGFGFAIIPVMALLMGGFAILFFFKDVVMVFIGSLLMMCGYLSGMAVFGALIRDYTPDNKAGMFQGLRICFQVLIPGIAGPAIGAAVLANADKILNGDGTYSFVPNENIFLAAFIAAAVTVIGLLPLCKLLKKK